MGQEQRFNRPAVTLLANNPQNLNSNKNGFMLSAQVLFEYHFGTRNGRNFCFFNLRMSKKKILFPANIFSKSRI